eukprot:43216_1
MQYSATNNVSFAYNNTLHNQSVNCNLPNLISVTPIIPFTSTTNVSLAPTGNTHTSSFTSTTNASLAPTCNTPTLSLTSTTDPSHGTSCTTTASTHSYVQLSTQILSSAGVAPNNTQILPSTGVAPNSTQILSVIKCDETLAAASSTFEAFSEILLTDPTFDTTLTCKSPTNDSTSTYKTSGDIFTASNTQIKYTTCNATNTQIQ